MNAALHPSLQDLVTQAGLDPALLQVGHPVREAAAPAPARESLFLIAGDAFASWDVPSLRALFRGSRVPPEMTDYPPEYVPVFFQIERQVLAASRIGALSRVPTDAELEEGFANLRRRPDGRSFGPAHDLVWQAAALALGTFALSEAEFGAIAGRLSRSARSWKKGPASREYVAYLQRTFTR